MALNEEQRRSSRALSYVLPDYDDDTLDEASAGIKITKSQGGDPMRLTIPELQEIKRAVDEVEPKKEESSLLAKAALAFGPALVGMVGGGKQGAAAGAKIGADMTSKLSESERSDSDKVDRRRQAMMSLLAKSGLAKKGASETEKFQSKIQVEREKNKGKLAEIAAKGEEARKTEDTKGSYKDQIIDRIVKGRQSVAETQADSRDFNAAASRGARSFEAGEKRRGVVEGQVEKNAGAVATQAEKNKGLIGREAVKGKSSIAVQQEKSRGGVAVAQEKGKSAVAVQGSKNEGASTVQGQKNEGASGVQGSKNQGAMGVQKQKGQDALELQKLKNQGAVDKAKLGGAKGPGAPKEPKQEQYMAAGYAKRIREAEDVFEALESSGYDPTAMRSTLRSKFPERFKGENYKSIDQAQRDFVNAILRKESGAAIAESEFESAQKQYFPAPGDSHAILAQKKRNRMQQFETLRAAAGPAYEMVPTAPMEKGQIGSEKPGASSDYHSMSDDQLKTELAKKLQKALGGAGGK